MELQDLEELPQKLLRAWRDRDLAVFKEALADGCDVNFEFKDEKFQPILGAIARDVNNTESKSFVEAVLAAPNIDRDKQYMSGKCAIHHAAEIANLPVLSALVNANANINALDQNGSTALHVLVQQKWRTDPGYRKCVELLLSREDVQVNVVNRKGFSAIHLAVSKNNRDAVVALLEKGSLLDIDNTSVMGVTTRAAILKQYPELESELPKDLGPEWSFVKMDGSQLFKILTQGETERFCTAFEKEMQDKSQRSLLTYCNGKYTFLQYACREKMPAVVQCLLNNKADPNYTPHNNNESAMDIAVRKGFPDILKMLLDASSGEPGENATGATPLHTVTKYCHNSPQHQQILQLLLAKRWDHQAKIDVNAQDCQGNTALHYAAAWSDNETILTIMNHGGYIGAENKVGETPLLQIPPKVLKAFLDRQIMHVGAKQRGQRGQTERFTFDYSFLAKPQERVSSETAALFEEKGVKGPTKMSQETKPILLMSQSQDHRHLITHPALTSFTYLKWQRIQAFFYVNLCFYLALCVLLTGYILFAYRPSPPVETKFENTLTDEIPHSIGPHDKVNLSKPDVALPQIASRGLMNLIIRAIILIFLILFFVREIFQFAISPRTYFKNFENYMELLLVFLSAYVIANDCSQHFGEHSKLSLICPQLSAVVVLLSWIQLVLLVGKHPQFSIQVEMFRTVSVSFIRFLTWYILIIIAFALSFFVLFRGCTGECSEKNPFTSPGTSMFKALVMLTGEFEAGDIPFFTYIGTSHVIFTAFVFLIAIVLLNLLNGLAVADTKEIRDDVYLYSCIARVKLISLVESMLLGDALNFLKPVYGWFDREAGRFILLDHFAKKIVFFPKLLPKGQIVVHCRKDRSVIEFVDGPVTARKWFSGYNMDKATIKAARELIAIRTTVEPQKDNIGPKVAACCEKIEQLSEKLLAFEKKFEAIEQSNKQIEKLLIQQMAIVSLNNSNLE